MKRIFIALAVASVLVSCEVQESKIRPQDSGELFNYASGVCGNYVTVPVELLELLLDFDEYMALPDKDREADPRFFGKVEQVDDNVYRFNDEWERPIQCTVDTQGKSLREKDAVWVLAFLDAWNFYEDDALTLYYDYSLPAYTEVRMTDVENSVWTIAYKEDFETVLKYKGQEDELDFWEVTSKGKCQSGKAELTARFSTGDAPLEVRERKMSEYGYHGNTYKGNFELYTYMDDKVLDYCLVTFRPGFTTQYETNR